MFLLVLGRLLKLLRPKSLRPSSMTPQPRLEFHLRRLASIGRRQESTGNITRQDAPDCRHASRALYYLLRGREIEGPKPPERPTGRIHIENTRVRTFCQSVGPRSLRHKSTLHLGLRKRHRLCRLCLGEKIPPAARYIVRGALALGLPCENPPPVGARRFSYRLVPGPRLAAWEPGWT